MDARRNSPAAETADCEIVLTRVFDAPRELVWQAWTDPRHVVHWWGPNGFTTTIEKMDVRPGGVWKHVMHGPDGADYPNSSVFKEVVKPERIVYSHGGGKKGGAGAQFEATWTFEALGDKTKVTIHMLFPTAADRDMVVKEYNAIEGGKQTLARFAEYLNQLKQEDAMDTAVNTTLTLSRTINATIEKVFDAWVTSEALTKWFAPTDAFKTEVLELDVRRHGRYRIAMIEPDGKVNTVNGVYETIDRPHKLIFTWEWENAGTPNRSMVTISLKRKGDQTELTLVHEGLATEELARRHQQGWNGCLERLVAMF